MSEYLMKKKQIEAALNDGKIDICFYHYVCAELDKNLRENTMPHYFDENKKTVLSK